MDALPMIYSDLISVVIVLYVWVRMVIEPSLERRAVRLFRDAGILLILAIIVDHIWEYCYEYSDFSAGSLNRLRVLASIEFLSVPATLFRLMWYNRKSWDIWDCAAAGADICLFILGILNCWYPIYFTLDEEGALVNVPGSAWVYLGALILFGFALIHDFVTVSKMDMENGVMIAFVLLITALGTADLYYYGDILSLWESYAIVYLLYYFALVRLFAKTDQVTELPNRNAFAVDYFHKRRRPVPVLVSFDLNHLKNFNDSQGHDTGDHYLRSFAQTAQKRLRPYGRLYRIGGDEFCLTSFSDPDQLREALGELQRAGKGDPEFGDFPLDFAYGMAERMPGESNEDFLRRADAEMYADKRREKSVCPGRGEE